VIESATLDYRDDPAYLAGDAGYRVIELPSDTLALAQRAAAPRAHVVSGVDLKRTGDGRFVLLEANAAPRWLDIEEKTGARITEAVLSLLVSPPT
jgi:glutathione synthase/RimK-type ligase-like ATP-grasp enzyme